MKKYKSSLSKILNAFVITTVISVSITLIASGIAISKVNTDYMSTGVHTAKIIAEHSNEEIFISINGQRLKQNTMLKPDIDLILSLAPAPINTLYLLFTEISDFVQS